MSRAALFLLLMMLAAPSIAQSQSDPEVAAKVDKVEKSTVDIDRNGCLRDPKESGPGIVVCGESEDTKSQRIFRDRHKGRDDVVRGEGVASTTASQCLGGGPSGNRGPVCSNSSPETIMPIGKDPEAPPPDYKTLISDLPPPEQVVTDQDYAAELDRARMPPPRR